MDKRSARHERRNILFMVNGVYYFADKYKWVKGMKTKRAYVNATSIVTYLTVLCPHSDFTYGIEGKDFVVKVKTKYNKVVNVRVHPNGDISIDGMVKRDKALRGVHPCVFVMFLLLSDVFSCRVSVNYLRERSAFKAVVAYHLPAPIFAVEARVRDIFADQNFHPTKK